MNKVSVEFKLLISILMLISALAFLSRQAQGQNESLCARVEETIKQKLPDTVSSARHGCIVEFSHPDLFIIVETYVGKSENRGAFNAWANVYRSIGGNGSKPVVKKLDRNRVWEDALLIWSNDQNTHVMILRSDNHVIMVLSPDLELLSNTEHMLRSQFRRKSVSGVQFMQISI